jgi:hypothetical protein
VKEQVKNNDNSIELTGIYTGGLPKLITYFALYVDEKG